jgi:type VI secretion system protein VasG
MIAVNLKSMFARLNEFSRNSLEAAAGLCLSRTNYNVEIEHWIYKLSETDGTDFVAILQHYGVNIDQLQADISKVLDGLKIGNTRVPPLSPDTVELAREAWLIASVEFAAAQTRTSHVLLSLLLDRNRARLARDLSPQFAKVSGEIENLSTEQLFATIHDLTSETAEASIAAQADAAAAESTGGPGRPAGGPTKTPSLDQYTHDLTAQAKAGKIDPVVGRDAEVRQIIDILMRRRQNNPILTGEAGVGKTAVVEGFARQIAAGDVPPPLQGVTLRSLDLGLLQAGASIKGEFENRLRGVIDEVKASPTPIIMFIDEAHMMIGAGGQAGQGDAANLLKPALARGELRTIAATTWAEYKKYFEKDPALTRRFQVVKVDEPTEDVAINMMQGLTSTLEKHHRVRILDEAIDAAVRLSHRYITGRQLPDKSVSLLDTASARVAIGHNNVPPAVEDLHRRIEQLDRRLSAVKREEMTNAKLAETIATLSEQRDQAADMLADLEGRWEKERELVTKINELRGKLEGEGSSESKPQAQSEEPAAEDTAAEGDEKDVDSPKDTAATEAAKLTEAQRAELQKTFAGLSEELTGLQGDSPLLTPCVDRNAIAEVVGGWTGIPVGRMVADEISTVLNLQQLMEERVVGQSHALEAIAQKIQTSRADLSDPGKPIAVFFMPGPSGVGKTETALTLAEFLYGGEQNVTTINMSEFKEEHKVSLLLGSPPGYVGYGEGGVLTEAVRRKPYSVVLLDEMEKAHPGVQDIFYQVFDKGMIKDGEGRDINFKNTVVIMTSNAASDVIMNLCSDPEMMPNVEGLTEAVYPELLKQFKPAFLGRGTIIPYYPLSDSVLRLIVGLKLNKIIRRLKQVYNAELTHGPELIEAIAQRCTEVESGARNVDNIISKTMLPELSAQILGKMAAGEEFSQVKVSLEDGEFRYEIA